MKTPLVFIHVVLIILKLAEVTAVANWSWWYVNVPLFITIIFVIIGAIVEIHRTDRERLSTRIVRDIQKKNRKPLF